MDCSVIGGFFLNIYIFGKLNQNNNQKKLASITLNKRIVKYHHHTKFHLYCFVFVLNFVPPFMFYFFLLGFIILKVYLADMSEIYIFIDSLTHSLAYDCDEKPFILTIWSTSNEGIILLFYFAISLERIFFIYS